MIKSKKLIQILMLPLSVCIFNISAPAFAETFRQCTIRVAQDQEYKDCFKLDKDKVKDCRYGYFCKMCLTDPKTLCVEDPYAKDYCKEKCRQDLASTTTQTSDSSTTSSQAQSDECSNLSSELAMYDASIAEEEDRLNRLKSERQEVEAKHNQICN